MEKKGRWRRHTYVDSSIQEQYSACPLVKDGAFASWADAVDGGGVVACVEKLEHAGEYLGVFVWDVDVRCVAGAV